MKQCLQILFLSLLLPAWLSGALLPGDFGVVRVANDKVIILALKQIPANEQIKVSDDFWIHGKFDGSGNEATITITQKLRMGEQFSIDLSAHGISFDWGETLHFYQESTAANVASQRHLFMVEANKLGLRWYETPPGLEADLTHIVLSELAGFEGDLNHIYNGGLLDLNLTPYQWLRALGNYRSWIHMDQYIDIPLLDLLGLEFLVLPSPGVIEFVADAYHLNELDGQITVPVRRLYGNSGTATVHLESTNFIEPLDEWDNESVDDFFADLTGIAYSAALDYAVAVSPDSGTLLVGKPGSWQAVDTNEDSQTNLKLMGITHDGTSFWACSEAGRIYESSNGTDWTLKYSPSTNTASLYRIVYLPEALAQGKPALIALGSDGRILYQDPSDGWQVSNSDSSGTQLFAVAFDGLNYVAVGEEGTILSTQDLAQKWQSRSSPTDLDLYSIFYSSASQGGGLYAVGKFGTMLHSANLSGGFSLLESSTEQTLYSINSAAMVVDPSTSETANFIVACGAGGTVIAAEDGGPFILRRSINRASALYSMLPITTTTAGAPESLVAIGEYGAIVSMDTAGHILSGNPDNIQLNDSTTTSLTWADLDNSEKYVVVNASSAEVLRQRTDLRLQYPLLGGSYRLGRHRTQVNLMDSINSRVALAPNFGPLLYLAGARVETNYLGQWEFKFKIGNTSNQSSNRLFLRFEGTNLPDWEIPSSQLPGNGAGIDALSVSADIIKVLTQPVESVSLYEEFRSGEPVLKYRKIINSLWSAPEWSPNDILGRSLGIYLLDDGSLLDTGIPGVLELLGLPTLPTLPIIPILFGSDEVLSSPVEEATASKSTFSTRSAQLLASPIEADADSTSAVLSQTVETNSLTEVVAVDEPARSSLNSINSFRAVFESVLNQFFPSLLSRFGIVGISEPTDSAEKVSEPEPSTSEPIIESTASSRSSYSTTSSSSGGSTFSDGVPTPPPNSPGDPELILTDTDAQGPTGLELRAGYTYFLEGDFYNTSTGLNEIYTINTVDWAITEDSAPAEGLHIETDGTFVASANPSFSYPREISTDSMTTEGAPLDDNDEPVEFRDSLVVLITRPASDLNFADWIQTKSSLSGDDALSDADPDHDNQVNLLEFALDLDPSSHDISNALSITYDAQDTNATFALTIPKDRNELLYTVETTSDLSTRPVVWTPQALTFVEDHGSTETWEATVEYSGQIFGRLRVEEDTP